MVEIEMVMLVLLLLLLMVVVVVMMMLMMMIPEETSGSCYPCWNRNRAAWDLPETFLANWKKP